MPDRLTRICTRTGDDGTTGLADGSRLPKDSLRIEAIGAVDELNSLLGVVLAQELPDALRPLIGEIQQRLFDLGGELALPGRTLLPQDAVARLDEALEGLNAQLPPLREFVLPGPPPAAAHCHQARTVCRRAERRLVQLGRSEALGANALKFLNRLSDLLFVIARTLARSAGAPEIGWVKPQPPGP